MEMNMSKQQWMKKHVKQRSQERCGMVLSTREQVSISNKIKRNINMNKDNKKIVFLSRQSNTRSLYAIFHNQKWFRVVYDKSRGCLITVLPLNCNPGVILSKLEQKV
jgi:hypothetical protein